MKKHVVRVHGFGVARPATLGRTAVLLKRSLSVTMVRDTGMLAQRVRRAPHQSSLLTVTHSGGVYPGGFRSGPLSRCRDDRQAPRRKIALQGPKRCSDQARSSPCALLLGRLHQCSRTSRLSSSQDRESWATATHSKRAPTRCCVRLREIPGRVSRAGSSQSSRPTLLTPRLPQLV